MKTEKKMLLLINPQAGQGEIQRELFPVLDLLSKHQYEVCIHITQRQGEITEVVKHKGNRFDVVVVSGGDGSLHELVVAVGQTGCCQKIGYLPAGTVNDYASNLLLPKNAYEAMEIVIAEKILRCDIGCFNDTYFSYVAAFGAFTEVSYATSQNAKNILGRAAYILKGIASLGDIQSYDLTISHDGQRIEGDFIFGMVSNSYSVGGIRFGVKNDITLDDGLFEVLLIKRPKNPAEFQKILSDLLQRGEPGKELTELDWNSKVLFFQTKAIHFEQDEPMPWTLDGEYGGDYRETMISVKNQALNMIVRTDSQS